MLNKLIKTIIIYRLFTIITVISILLFYITGYLTITRSLTAIKAHLILQIKDLELEFKSNIKYTQSLIYTLVKILQRDAKIYSNQQDTDELLSYYQPINNVDDIIQLGGLIVLNKENQSIAHLNENFKNLKFIPYNFNHLKSIKKVEKQPYQLIIGEKIISRYTNQQLITLGMGFVDQNNQYLGSVYTGIITENLNNRLLAKSLLKRIIKDIELIEPHDSLLMTVDLTKLIDQLLNQSNVIRGYLFNQPIIIDYPVLENNFLLKVVIDTKYLFTELIINRYIYLNLIYLLLILSSTFLVIKYLIKPIQLISKIVDNNDLITSSKLLIGNQKLQRIYDYILTNQQEKLSKLQEIKQLELEREQLNYIFLTQNYSNDQNLSIINEAAVLKQALRSYSNSKSSSYLLKNLISEIAIYCSECFNIDIQLIEINQQDLKIFLENYTAFSHAMISIFCFVSKYQSYNNQEVCMINSYLAEDNYIIIEIIIPIINQNTIIDNIYINNYWYQQNYGKLLTIYQLAKLNNYGLLIEQINNLLYFRLVPLASKISNRDFIPQQLFANYPNQLKFTSAQKSLRKKLLTIGQENLTDLELLELILSFIPSQYDIAILAKKLITKFKTLPQIIISSTKELLKVEGINLEIIIALKISCELTVRITKEAAFDSPLMNSTKALIAYIRANMGHNKVEQFRILYLNKQNHLIVDELQSNGTIDHVMVYPREVIKKALLYEATFLILIHNHPSGVVKPSLADINLTQQIIKAARLFNIEIIDHIIISSRSSYSFKRHGLI